MGACPMTDYRDTPAGAISRLDAALSRRGEDVTLSRVVKRGASNVTATVTCRASVRAVSSEDISTGAMKATEYHVVISPTEIMAARWPGQNDNDQAGINAHVPMVTDVATIQGEPKQVVAAKPIYVGGEWVRADLVVAG